MMENNDESLEDCYQKKKNKIEYLLHWKLEVPLSVWNQEGIWISYEAQATQNMDLVEDPMVVHSEIGWVALRSDLDMGGLNDFRRQCDE